jgi:uroporphyrinogen-III synthase
MPGAEVVLITRSEPGASETAARLRDLGYRAILTPMTAVRPLPLPTSFDGAQALLVTSANGARRLAEAPKPIPRVLAVGGATAEAARAAGATDVVSADADGAALLELALKTLDPAEGEVAVWRGRDAAVDLKSALEAEGFRVVEHVVYAAEARQAVSPEAAEALAEAAVDAVLFHSARGARLFAAAVAAAGLGAGLTGAIAVSISPAAGVPAMDSGFKAVVASAQPLEMSLLRALTSALNSAS